METNHQTESVADELLEALDTLARRTNLPRVYQHLIAASGSSHDRSCYWLAIALANFDGLRPSDLSELQGTDLSTVSRQIQASERAGLVERAPDPADARATLIRLTPRGREVLRQIRTTQRAEILAAVSGWSEEDQRAFARLLSRFASQFLAWAVEPPRGQGRGDPMSRGGTR